MQDEKFSEGFDKLWEILKSSEEEKYTGYIIEDEWSKLSAYLNESCDVANKILSSFSKVLNIGQIDEYTGFIYILSEDITSVDSESKYVSVEQLLMRYEADKMFSLPYESGLSEPIFDLDPEFLTAKNELLKSYDVSKKSLSDDVKTDSITGLYHNEPLCNGETNYSRDGYDTVENSLFNSWIIHDHKEIDDLLNNHYIDKDYSSSDSRNESIPDIYDNNDGENLFGSDSDNVE
jgi:hypothetical protein